MQKFIEFTNGEYGIKATIKAKWDDSFLHVLQKKDVKELELNDGFGWKCDDLCFLEYLPNLYALTIIDYKIESLKPVEKVVGLRKLELLTYSSDAVNFQHFPNLIDCSFEWIKGSESLFEMSNIRSLFLNSYRGKESNVFSKLVNLENLVLLNSQIENIEGLVKLKKLKTLRLGNLKKLKQLCGINELQLLESLEIHRCKNIKSINLIFELMNLKKLFLNDLGEIESLEGVEKLKNLETFMFYESTNISDGSLTPLLLLKKLKKVSFQNRRHYTHKREELENLYN